MKLNIFTKFYKSFRKLLAFIPTKLPIGDQQFVAWYEDLTYLYDLPKDNDSIRLALCTTVMHLPPTSYYKSKRFFGLTLLKGAAQQQAYNIMSDVKERQEARKKAEEAARAALPQLAAVTAPEGANSGNGQPKA